MPSVDIPIILAIAFERYFAAFILTFILNELLLGIPDQRNYKFLRHIQKNLTSTSRRGFNKAILEVKESILFLASNF